MKAAAAAWRDVVLALWQVPCIWHGNCSGGTEVHHLIHRSNLSMRFDPRNGIPLCSYHHRYSQIAPHVSPKKFDEFLRDYHRRVFDWYKRYRWVGGPVKLDFRKIEKDLKEFRAIITQENADEIRKRLYEL